MKKVMVEIHESQVVESLRQAIVYRLHDFFKQQPEDMAAAVLVCDAMNRTIEYFGGQTIDVGLEIARQRVGSTGAR